MRLTLKASQVLALLFMVLPISGEAVAQTSTSGDYLAMCDSTPAICDAFVAGNESAYLRPVESVNQSVMDLVRERTGKPEWAESAAILDEIDGFAYADFGCPPKSANLREVWIKFLLRNPGLHSKPAAETYWQARQQEFPCPGS